MVILGRWVFLMSEVPLYGCVSRRLLAVRLPPPLLLALPLSLSVRLLQGYNTMSWALLGRSRL